MAQQVMAEQSKRMADFMFWQLILGVALLIGVCVTIYYARQIARAAVNAGPRAPVAADPTQRAEVARILAAYNVPTVATAPRPPDDDD